MMRRRRQVCGWAVTLALIGCTNRPADVAPPAAPEPAVAAPAAAAEPSTLHRLALRLQLPPDWREAAPDDGDPERLSAVFQRADGADLPQVQITLSRADQFEDARAKGLEPRQLVIDVLRGSIEGGGQGDEVKGKVTTEEPWTAPGIVAGTRLRIAGDLPKAEFGADQGVVEVLVGETAGGDIYTVLVAANDVAGIDLAQPLLASVRYGLGGAPDAAAGAAGTTTAPPVAAPGAEAEPQPVTPLPEAN